MQLWTQTSYGLRSVTWHYDTATGAGQARVADPAAASVTAYSRAFGATTWGRLPEFKKIAEFVAKACAQVGETMAQTGKINPMSGLPC